MSERVRLVRGDLTAPSLPGVEGPFDLLVDYGTLDDLAPTDRRAMAATIIRLARPGSIFVLYAFYAARADLPRFSLTGPSRLVPVLEPGEEVELFGDAFEIERLPEPRPEHLTAAFVMTRRDHQAAGRRSARLLVLANEQCGEIDDAHCRACGIKVGHYTCHRAADRLHGGAR